VKVRAAEEIDALEAAAFAGRPLSDDDRVYLIHKHLTALVGVAGDGRDLFEEKGFRRQQPDCVSAHIESMQIPPGARVLLIDLRMIGDAVQAGEMAAAMAAKTSCTISYLGLKDCARVIARCSAIHRVYEVDIHAALRDESSALDAYAVLCEQLRGAFDAVVNVNQTIAAMLFAQASKAALVYGWSLDAVNRGVFRGNRYHHRLLALPYQHLLEQMLRTVSVVPPVRAPRPLFAPADAWRTRLPQGCVGFFIGARIATRQWNQEGWIACAQGVVAGGRKVVLFGGKAEQDLARRIAQAVPGVIDLCGEVPLEELGSVVACCALFVTTDSGGKHAAAAAGVPCVEVSGAGNRFEQCGPYAARSVIIQRDEPCLHCLKNECSHRRCMRLISVDTVLAAIDAVFAAGDMFERAQAEFAAPQYAGYSLWFTSSRRPDIAFAPLPLRKAWTPQELFDRMTGFCDDVAYALLNEHATGEASVHTMTADNVLRTLRTAGDAVRVQVCAQITQTAVSLAQAVREAGTLREIDAMAALCDRAMPAQARWMIRSTFDLAMLGALRGAGDETQRVMRALADDLRICADAWERLRAMTEAV
jgi:ADP-heptose:LPS heptosyltransferase